MQAIVLIVVLYLLYQLVVFLFNSGLLLITVIILLAIFILWIYIGASNAVNKEKKEREKLSSLENEWNSKYEIWEKDNINILKIQEVYEKKGYSKIDLGYQFNELSARYEAVKNKQIDSGSHNQKEKDMLKLEKRFLRNLGEKVIKEKFWRNSYGAHRIFYIFIEDSILKIREKIIFGSKFLNECLDIRVEDIFYYQESGKIETSERRTGYVRQSESPGVIGSAIVGGLIAGSTGAIVGGISGLNNANKRSTEYTITEHRDNRGVAPFFPKKVTKYEFSPIKIVVSNIRLYHYFYDLIEPAYFLYYLI